MIVNLILLSMNKEGLEVQLLQEKIDHLQKTLPVSAIKFSCRCLGVTYQHVLALHSLYYIIP